MAVALETIGPAAHIDLERARRCALMLIIGGVEGGLFSCYPTCTAAGIDSAGGNEGTCTEGLLTSLTTVNVVDRARVLHMPEYDTRLLVSQIKPTRASNASEHRYYYPNDLGQLVSYKLSITNTGTRPLWFGLGARYEPRASYASNPLVWNWRYPNFPTRQHRHRVPADH
jgi:hypothetical protein